MPRRASNLARTRLACRVAVAGAMMIAPAVLHASQDGVEPPNDNCGARHLRQSVTVDQVVFKAYRNVKTGDSCLEVEEAGHGEAGHKERVIGKLAGKLVRKDNGEVVFRRAADSVGPYTLGQPANEQYNILKIENGTDITGRGRPDMIVTKWSGGARCCFVHYVFELEPKLKLLAQLDDGEGDRAHFAALDEQRRYYYLGNDWTFAYWDASFLNSHAPAVILGFVEDGQGGGFHLAMEKMQRPVPTKAEWDKAVREAGDAFAGNNLVENGVGSGLWGNMLDLIYTGHSDLAWKLYDQTWPAKKTGKEKFLSGFCSQLKTSPYWPDLKETIPSAPPACANANPERPGE